MKAPVRGLVLGLKLLVSGGLLYLLYRRAPLEDIMDLLARADKGLVALIMVLLLCNTVLSSVKWRIFLRADGVDAPLGPLVVTYLIGGFFNVFLPSNIGGDSYRMLHTARQCSQAMSSVVSVIADRATGFLALVSLSLLAAPVVAARLHSPAFVFLPLTILCVLSAVLFALYRREPVRRIMALTRLDRWPPLERLANKALASVERYASQPRLLGQVMAISFVFQFSVVVAVYLMALSLGARAPFVFFAAFVPLITLLEAIPLSIYGLGIRDAGYVFFFGWAGMSEVQTRSLSMLFVACSLGFALLGGVLLLLRMLRDGQAGESTR